MKRCISSGCCAWWHLLFLALASWGATELVPEGEIDHDTGSSFSGIIVIQPDEYTSPSVEMMYSQLDLFTQALVSKDYMGTHPRLSSWLRCRWTNSMFASDMDRMNGTVSTDLPPHCMDRSAERMLDGKWRIEAQYRMERMGPSCTEIVLSATGNGRTVEIQRLAAYWEVHEPEFWARYERIVRKFFSALASGKDQLAMGLVAEEAVPGTRDLISLMRQHSPDGVWDDLGQRDVRRSVVSVLNGLWIAQLAMRATNREPNDAKYFVFWFRMSDFAILRYRHNVSVDSGARFSLPRWDETFDAALEVQRAASGGATPPEM